MQLIYRRQRTYRRIMLALVLIAALILALGVRADAFTVTYKHMISGDQDSGKIMKGTVKTRPFTIHAYVRYDSVRYNHAHHHTRVNYVSAVTNFKGTEMGCAGTGVFANGHHETRLHFYFKDDKGRNHDFRKRLPCSSNTYAHHRWKVYVPSLFRGARWKCNWTMDVRGHNDQNGTLSGHFRRN